MSTRWRRSRPSRTSSTSSTGLSSRRCCEPDRAAAHGREAREHALLAARQPGEHRGRIERAGCLGERPPLVPRAGRRLPDPPRMPAERVAERLGLDALLRRQRTADLLLDDRERELELQARELDRLAVPEAPRGRRDDERATRRRREDGLRLLPLEPEIVDDDERAPVAAAPVAGGCAKAARPGRRSRRTPRRAPGGRRRAGHPARRRGRSRPGARRPPGRARRARGGASCRCPARRRRSRPRPAARRRARRRPRSPGRRDPGSGAASLSIGTGSATGLATSLSRCSSAPSTPSSRTCRLTLSPVTMTLLRMSPPTATLRAPVAAIRARPSGPGLP